MLEGNWGQECRECGVKGAASGSLQPASWVWGDTRLLARGMLHWEVHIWKGREEEECWVGIMVQDYLDIGPPGRREGNEKRELDD